MNPVERLRAVREGGLRQCENNITQWEKLKKDYEALKERLETLPDSLSYDVTVPFGSNAFTLGKLVHTNEIMVLIGDDWFVEVSAKQAVSIANRKILQCSKMLEDFNREKQLHENELKYLNEEFGNGEHVDITENYDEEEERKWREQHRENVKAYRQKLAELKHDADNQNGSNSDEEYRIKLENLELMEAESDLREGESDRSMPECSDDGSQHSELPCKPSLKLNINCNNTQMCSESETGEEMENSIKSKDLNANLEVSSPTDSVKHVRWQDLSKQNIKRITFKHSKSKHKQNQNAKKEEVKEGEEQPLIQSPSDIYKHFGNLFQMNSPKSILKVRSVSVESNESCVSSDEIMPKENFPESRKESIITAFTGEVRECSSPLHATENKTPRP
ncbi:Unconventional prefoldin RPB5 interactor 1, partial [Stegodyphus mimosarum]